MKKVTRKKYAEERSYSLGTGGGREHSSTVTSLDEQVKNLLGNQIHGIQSEFDSDSPTDQMNVLPNVEFTETSVALVEPNVALTETGVALAERNVVAETIVMEGSVISEAIEIPYRVPGNVHKTQITVGLSTHQRCYKKKISSSSRKPT